jgi:hypothetical protein
MNPQKFNCLHWSATSFKGNIKQKYFRGKYPHTVSLLYRKKLGNSRLHSGDFRIDFLGEYDFKCETALGRESGP